jgi:ABC-type transporter Mla subunit MlaD
MKFRLGVFVLGAAILLAILIILFGQFPTVFTNQVHYSVSLPQAPGVEPGTPVRKSGVKIGEVTAVDLQPVTGEVTVHIAVDRKFQLLQADQPTLGRGLLGDTSINFELEKKDAAKEVAPSGHVFTGQVSPDLAGALRRASDLLPATESALQEIRGAARAFNETIPELRRTNAEIQLTASNVGRAAEGVDNFLRGNNDRLVKAIDNFVEAAGRTAELLNEENRKNLTTSLQNVRNASNRLEALVKDTETLIQESQKTVKTVNERVDSVGKNADAFITEARTTLKNTGDRIDSTTKNAETLITDTQKAVKQIGDRVDSVGRNAETLVAEARQTVKVIGDRVDSTGRNADELIKEGRATVKRVNDTLTRTDEVMANLQTATKPLAERAPTVMKNLEDSSARINQISHNFAEFSKSLTQGDGTIQRLIADPSLYNNVNGVATNLNKSMARFDCILRDLELFADKVARHPELLGVSGAVSPSSGIKR